VLVVAGEVCEGSSARALSIVARLAGGKPTVFVMDNHEPWHRDFDRERVAARHATDRHGIVLLDDNTAEVCGIRFVSGTLRADGLPIGRDALPARETGRAGARHARTWHAPDHQGRCGRPASPNAPGDREGARGAARWVSRGRGGAPHAASVMPAD